MRLFGYDLRVTKAAVPPTDMSAFDSRVNGRGWMTIQEPFTGAWQRNMEADRPDQILAFSAVYACLSFICGDISTLRPKLTQLQSGIWQEITNGAFSPVLRKPNQFQTRVQFFAYWLASKLLAGNAYIWKEYDARNVVRALYVLNPCRVEPRVGVDGSVWYALKRDDLSGQPREELIVPADEIIHDRCLTPWHPLIGVSPIVGYAASATQGVRIQANSEQFFRNASRPGGILSPKLPGKIEPEKADLLKSKIEEATTGRNVGRLLVFTDEMLYQAMGISADNAQLVEQLKFTVEDVGRAHKVPLYKLGIGQPTFSNILQMAQDYYDSCLREHVEGIEVLLDEALALPADMHVEFDVEAGLFRMDPLARADLVQKLVAGRVLAPNEGRSWFNLPPVDGGDKPFAQQQDWPLDQLAEREPPSAQPAPAMQPSATPPAPSGAPASADQTPTKTTSVVEKEFTDLELAGIDAMTAAVIERARVGGDVA